MIHQLVLGPMVLVKAVCGDGMPRSRYMCYHFSYLLAYVGVSCFFFFLLSSFNILVKKLNEATFGGHISQK